MPYCTGISGLLNLFIRLINQITVLVYFFFHLLTYHIDLVALNFTHMFYYCKLVVLNNEILSTLHYSTEFNRSLTLA